MFENQSPEKRKALTGTEFRKGNLPGTDLYDDGLNHKGELVMPASTTSEGAGNYMDDKGPNDLVRREETIEDEAAMQGLDVRDTPEVPLDDEDDDAARWLRENDPGLK